MIPLSSQQKIDQVDNDNNDLGESSNHNRENLQLQPFT